MHCFCEDLPDSKTAEILEINRKTINSYYNDFRTKIFEYLNNFEKEKSFDGEGELDESYCGG